MRYWLLLVSCMLAPPLFAAKPPVPQPFGIDFGQSKEQLEEQWSKIDCRQFNGGPLCRYRPVENSIFAWYEVQYSAVSHSIITVMGTTSPFDDHYRCQSRLLDVNRWVRHKYQLHSPADTPHTIAYSSPPISMLCTADNEFHIIYRNPTLPTAQIEAESREAAAAAQSNPYADQF